MLEKILLQTRVLEKSLDAISLRNETISQNIANVDTPGYTRKTVSFEDQLRSALDESRVRGFRNHPKHIPIGDKSFEDIDLKVTQDGKSLDMRLDGNNVDIESEMAQMAKNTIKYDVLAQRISGTFSRLKSVISEGRR